MSNFFTEQNIDLAILNIQKFSKLAHSMGLIVEVGFFGGKK